MFTGLIEEIGKVISLERRGSAAVINVAASFQNGDTSIGDSVAVNGACLTVTAMAGGTFSFDVSSETLERTTLGRLKSGDPVNLERALRLSDRLGGHIVTGHIDCLGHVSARRQADGNTFFAFSVPDVYARYLVEKGSVAIDGVSLTVNEATDAGFSVNIIPHTLAMTTLRGLKTGDPVNIETDILAKYLERLLAKAPESEAKGVTLDLLAKSGFL